MDLRKNLRTIAAHNPDFNLLSCMDAKEFEGSNPVRLRRIARGCDKE